MIFEIVHEALGYGDIAEGEDSARTVVLRRIERQRPQAIELRLAAADGGEP
ncbi:MAG: hypothetical protein U1E87_01355 [Alphaproteobacteria bacterium]